jgi:Restriction endonuclease
MSPALSNFKADADELRRQEIARLTDALTPRLEALRSMTAQGFRSVVALMLERFGHTIISNPEAPELVSSKLDKKFITACATPADLAPTGTRDLARLHDAVIAANAQRGFFITARSFTDQAEKYAESAPLDLIDSARLIKALNQSRKHVLLPQTYKAMCQQCGEIVQHRLDREQDEARPCGNGHLVAPTISRAMLLPPRPAATGSADSKTKPAPPRPLSRREIRAHNYKYEARLMKKPRGG